MKLTVNLTVNVIVADKIFMRDNGLQAPLMVKWECPKLYARLLIFCRVLRM